MKKTSFLLILCLGANLCYSKVEPPRNLMMPPAAKTDSTITLLWDKPLDYAGVTGYEIYQDGKLAGTSTRCNFRATGLEADKSYTFAVKARSGPATSKAGNPIKVSTNPKGKTFLVTDFGAVGDGATDNTKAIQKAIDACTPDGTVVVPAGTFVSGALFIEKNDMTLFLSPGAVLKGTHDLAGYPMIQSRYEGVEQQTCASLINCGAFAGGATNIAIRGPGTLEEEGSYLSGAQTKAMSRSVRSHGLLMLHCDHVYLEGFTIHDSPTWCIHPIYCNGVTTEGVTIKTESAVPNADGWDPDSSSDCYLFNSTLSTHDDDIAVKSGKDADGRRVGLASRDLRVTDCLFQSGGGFALGSEMSGSISNVFVQDCHFVSVDRGFIIKSRRGRGGIVQNVVIKDCTVERCGGWGFNLEMYYYDKGGTPVQPPEATPIFRNCHFENIVIDRTSGPAVTMRSLPESRISNVSFKNVTIKDADKGCIVTDCDNVSFKDFSAKVRTGPVWNTMSDNKNLSIEPAPPQ